tara:strand:- start:32 stop:784 length:753 start_codon:yes stop_codon:yes gene_type:complete
MKVVASIEARMQSTRLPGKVLKPLAGKPVLWHIVERLKKCKTLDEIFIATSKNSSDDPVFAFAKENGISFFRGSEDDVLDRLAKAHKWFGTKVVVEITGDSPLIDPELVDLSVTKFLEQLEQNQIDYLSNTLTRTYPIGQRVQVFKNTLLQEAAANATEEKDREHVTTYICRNKDKYKLYNLAAPEEMDYPKMRLTLDYQEDYEMISKVYDSLYESNPDFCLKDIISFLNDNPDVANINKDCVQISKEGA